MSSNRKPFHENFNRKQGFVAGSDTQFGFTFASIFLLFFLISILKHHPNYYFILISVFYFFSTLFLKKIISWQNKKWTRFGLILQKFISPIILFVLFFGVITPTAFLLKIFKKDILHIST
jgi:hypothetical protein